MPVEGAAGPSESSGVADAEDTEGWPEVTDENTEDGAVAAEEAIVEDAEEEPAAAEAVGIMALKVERRAAMDLADFAALEQAVLAAPPPRLLTGLLRTLECN